jgi:hemoglobin
MMVLPPFLQKLLMRFQKTPYQRLGGQAAIARLVDDFYQIMATDPAARECLATHQGRDLQASGEKLKLFLSGWLGGPPLYQEQHGHPRLRMRHFPFAIGPQESEQWLYCMEKALDLSRVNAGLKTELMTAFRGLTGIIQNRP